MSGAGDMSEEPAESGGGGARAPGTVVWVKLGSCWWPGTVVDAVTLPPNALRSLRKTPIAIVQFFQEESFEFVRNESNIFDYNCSRKDDFIKKGLDMYRAKHSHMEKFPEDVIRAEELTGGDVQVLTRPQYQQAKKESYAGLFGESAQRRTPARTKGRPSKSRQSTPKVTPSAIRKVNHTPSNYKAHILVQGCSTPAWGAASASLADEPPSSPAPVAPAASGLYTCHACPFSSSRLNVLVLHTKTHSVTFTPYVPTPKKKQQLKTPKKSPVAAGAESASVRTRKPRKSNKRAADSAPAPVEAKKPKSVVEIKNTLLADWEDGDDSSMDEPLSAVAAGATPASHSPDPSDPQAVRASPAPPDPRAVQASPDPNTVRASPAPPAILVSPDPHSVRASPAPPAVQASPEAPSTHTSCFDFREEDEPPGKMARVKRADASEEVAREVDELLEQTAVPDLPAPPPATKFQLHSPEAEKVKSFDKPEEAPINKVIFKTKTFFRSRHSRSQDAIEKYVAEQLSAAERHDADSPEAAPSPPPVVDVPLPKLTRLAPKIQLKKMKAEARAPSREDSSPSGEDYTPPGSLPSDDADTRSQHSLEWTDAASAPALLVDARDAPLGLSKDSLTRHISDDPPDELLEDDLPSDRVNGVRPDTNGIDSNGPYAREPRPECSEGGGAAPGGNLDEETSLQSKHSEEDRSLPTGNSEEETSLQNINFEDEKSVESRNSLEDISLHSKPSEEEKSIQERNSDRILESGNSADDISLKSKNSEDTLLQSKHSSEETTSSLRQNSEEEKSLQSENIENDQVCGSMNVEEKVLKNRVSEEDKSLSSKSEPDIILKYTNREQKLTEQHLLTNFSIDTEMGLAQEAPDQNARTTEVAADIPENVTESDLQIAETLISLPGTALALTPTLPSLNRLIETAPPSAASDNSTSLFRKEKETPAPVESGTEAAETETEKHENLNAAQSLVEMSKSIEPAPADTAPPPPVLQETDRKTIENEMALLTDTIVFPAPPAALPTLLEKSPTKNKFETTSSKLLQILEEPPKVKALPKMFPSKQLIPLGKEKILNFKVNSATAGATPASPHKQKIIIRRTAVPATSALSTLVPTSQDELVVSRSSKLPARDGVSTYTIETAPDLLSQPTNTILIQQKARKITRSPPKLQKIKPHSAPVHPPLPPPPVDDTIFDINSMPIVLSDDLLTPESIERMPIVMSDGTTTAARALPASASPAPAPKPTPKATAKPAPKPHTSELDKSSAPKSDVKTILMTPIGEKSSAPNILSKSSKIRGTKPMLIVDKLTGEQKIIMTKTDPTSKEIKITGPRPAVAPSPSKGEKFIILPTGGAVPRSTRTQKIVISPQPGKPVLLAKPGEPASAQANTKVSASKPQAGDAAPAGGTVMIITNASGGQSRIVLTPEHEKLLFPNKAQPAPALKPSPRPIAPTAPKPQIIVTTVAPPPTKSLAKPQPRIISKQKQQQQHAIITSKGQLIVSGTSKPATTVARSTVSAETRPSAATVRTFAPASTKLVRPAPSAAPPKEPVIILQQKSGAIMQLTAAQFEHLQRTGQIVQKTSVTKMVTKPTVQKQPARAALEETPHLQHKQKAKPTRPAVPAPAAPPRRVKPTERVAPAPEPPVPLQVPTAPVPQHNNLSELDNLEELLPSTAIARPAAEQPAPPPPPPDNQLLAVPGENFGGPPNSFYLCVEENGTLTPIDNRPLVLDNNQLVPMAPEEEPARPPTPERRDILAAALANTDVFRAEAPAARDDLAPDFRDLNANVSVHCRVSETSMTLNQPIMTPLEVPSHADGAVPASLEDVIGAPAPPPNVPTSLELPITVTDPRIASPRASNPMLPDNYTSISMPLLTDDHDLSGKSMPILTEPADAAWAQAQAAPASDESDVSAEIPIQQALQLSACHVAPAAAAAASPPPHVHRS